MPLIDYRNKSFVDENGFVPFYVKKTTQGGKVYTNFYAYYNPRYEMSHDFVWWQNEFCKTAEGWKDASCQLPSDVSNMEAVIYDSLNKKWYYCKSISASANRNNWIEMTDMVEDNGYLSTPTKSQIEKAQRDGTGIKAGGDKNTDNEKVDPDKDADEFIRYGGWVKMERLQNSQFFRAYAKMMTNIFGEGTPKKKRALLFLGIGLATGKVLSNKKKQ